MSESMQNYSISLSPDYCYYNYFCTCFVYFFKDGGIFAVCIISFIYGLICNFFYNNMKSKNNLRNRTLYCFILVGIFTSMMHFCFSYFIYVMGLIYIILITNNSKFIVGNNAYPMRALNDESR